MIDGHIAYKVKRKVILASDKKRIILPNVHEGLGDEPKTKTLAAQHEGKSTYQKLTACRH